MGAVPNDSHCLPPPLVRTGKAKALRSLLDDIMGEDTIVIPFPFTHPLPRYTRCYGSLARFDWGRDKEGGATDLSSRACGSLLNDIVIHHERCSAGQQKPQTNRSTIAPATSPRRRITSRRGANELQEFKGPAGTKVLNLRRFRPYEVSPVRVDLKNQSVK